MCRLLKHLGLFLLTTILITAQSCDDDDALPEATQSGENIMAFTLDGDQWEAGVLPGIQGKPTEAFYSSGGKHLVITGRRRDGSSNETIEINQLNFDGTGTYQLGCQSDGDANFRVGDDKKYRTMTEEFCGTLRITRFDTDAKIVAGTFQFDALHGQDMDDADNAIKVRDGRFDIRLQVN